MSRQRAARGVDGDAPSVRRIALAVEADEAELLRYLGYPAGKSPGRRLAKVLPELREQALALAKPVGCYRVVTQDELLRASFPAPSAEVAVGLVTISEALEHVAAQRSAAGDQLAAMVFDAFGSATVEAAAEQLSREIRCTVGRLGLYAQRRVSPGYGAWHVRHQAELLELLPAAELGVTLTAGMMMVPRKSVSFAMRLSPSEIAGELPAEDDRCSSCDIERCPFSRGARCER